MKLLLSGDLHIGRSSTRVPESISREVVRAAAAWGRIVDLAIAENVNLVCLSGDVVDRDNKFWEAIGTLENGIRRLAKANIRTVAVAGNHDYDVLSRLSDNLAKEHFTLLGRNSNWERMTVVENGVEKLHIDGWSFPSQRVHSSPLVSYDLPNDANVPILGMVHGDLDAVNTPYAKLEIVRLQSLPPAGWLLGHVHASRLVSTEGLPWVLYPGSPQALDPGEPGLHGPWIVTIAAHGLGIPQQYPLSSIWYDSCDIDLSDATREADVEGTVLRRIREEGERIINRLCSPPAVISLRLRLIGSTAAAPNVRVAVEHIVNDFMFSIGDSALCIDTIAVETIPAVDLAEHARTKAATGVLARLLMELDGKELSSEVDELMRQTRTRLEDLERHRDFAALGGREIDDYMVRNYLRTEARALLTKLLSQTA